MKKRKIVGIVIILVGVAIFSYPLIKQAYSAHRQTELKEAFYELLKVNQSQNAQNSTLSLEDDLENTAVSPTPVEHLPEEETQTETIQYIDLEETEVVTEEQTANNINDRLKGQTVLGLIEIDQIDLIYAIVEGTSDYNLGVAIGHMTSTASLGAIGNCALAGHRGGTSGPYFKRINELKAGDEIKITDVNGNEYAYEVTESFVVEPTDLSVIDQTSEQKILTLITCQDSGTKRLIVRAVCQ